MSDIRCLVEERERQSVEVPKFRQVDRDSLFDAKLRNTKPEETICRENEEDSSFKAYMLKAIWPEDLWLS